MQFSFSNSSSMCIIPTAITAIQKRDLPWGAVTVRGNAVLRTPIRMGLEKQGIGRNTITERSKRK